MNSCRRVKGRTERERESAHESKHERREEKGGGKGKRGIDPEGIDPEDKLRKNPKREQRDGRDTIRDLVCWKP